MEAVSFQGHSKPTVSVHVQMQSIPPSDNIRVSKMKQVTSREQRRAFGFPPAMHILVDSLWPLLWPSCQAKGCSSLLVLTISHQQMAWCTHTVLGHAPPQAPCAVAMP